MYFCLVQQQVALCPVQAKLFQEKADQLERVQRKAEKWSVVLEKKEKTQEREIERISVTQFKEQKDNSTYKNYHLHKLPLGR